MIEKAQEFLQSTLEELNKYDLMLNHWEIDHLCYRTETVEEYELVKTSLTKSHKLLEESPINGRLISTIKLSSPIRFKNYIIDLIEVPAPKEGSPYQSGFEHIEVVIDCSFDVLKRKAERQGLSYKVAGSPLNSELVFKFDLFSVKFHHKSLEHVINIEQHEGIMNFLTSTKVLERFAHFSPCLSGTIPLQIALPSSDVDILMCSDNLEDFTSLVKEHYSHFPNFSISETMEKNEPSMTVNFTFDHLEIELFCQRKTSYEQQANLHFLIEGRLLKILGEDFRQEVLELKRHGLKTEPAFGQLLQLSSPYQQLLELQKMDDYSLQNTLQKVWRKT